MLDMFLLYAVVLVVVLLVLVSLYFNLIWYPFIKLNSYLPDGFHQPEPEETTLIHFYGIVNIRKVFGFIYLYFADREGNFLGRVEVKRGRYNFNFSLPNTVDESSLGSYLDGWRLECVVFHPVFPGRKTVVPVKVEQVESSEPGYYQFNVKAV